MTPATIRDCSEARLALSLRLDGEPCPAELLDAHLARCAECSEHERALARFAPAWRTLGPEAPPPALWGRIEAALEPVPRAPRRWPRLALSAAAGLLGFLGADLAGRSLGPRPPRTHLLERWLDPPRSEPHRLLASSPEYRLLLSRLPTTEDER
jgi:ferric-dicitrate binding protein FerR (iron transport regulator)